MVISAVQILGKHAAQKQPSAIPNTEMLPKELLAGSGCCTCEKREAELRSGSSRQARQFRRWRRRRQAEPEPPGAGARPLGGARGGAGGGAHRGGGRAGGAALVGRRRGRSAGPRGAVQGGDGGECGPGGAGAAAPRHAAGAVRGESRAGFRCSGAGGLTRFGC